MGAKPIQWYIAPISKRDVASVPGHIPVPLLVLHERVSRNRNARSNPPKLRPPQSRQALGPPRTLAPGQKHTHPLPSPEAASGRMANRFRGGGGVSLKPENSLKRAEELIGVSRGPGSGMIAQRQWNGLFGGCRTYGRALDCPSERPGLASQPVMSVPLPPRRHSQSPQVGQKQNALQTLHDTLTNKRHQRNWNTALEQVWPEKGGSGSGHRSSDVGSPLCGWLFRIS